MNVTSNNHIRVIKEGKKVYAFVYNHRLHANGTRFLTPAQSTLQVGLLEHPKDTAIRAHRHPSLKYRVGITQEFLYIERGLVEASIHRNNWSVLKKVTLSAGDFILFLSGGHSFRILKPCRIIEIKQGPYPGEAKAKIFMPTR